MLKDLQQEIMRIKKERDVCILAHSYMSEAICEVADFTGDSYALSVKAKTAPQSVVVMCGVRFMAEILGQLGAQISNPSKARHCQITGFPKKRLLSSRTMR